MALQKANTVQLVAIRIIAVSRLHYSEISTTVFLLCTLTLLTCVHYENKVYTLSDTEETTRHPETTADSCSLLGLFQRSHFAPEV